MRHDYGPPTPVIGGRGSNESQEACAERLLRQNRQRIEENARRQQEAQARDDARARERRR